MHGQQNIKKSNDESSNDYEKCTVNWNDMSKEATMVKFKHYLDMWLEGFWKALSLDTRCPWRGSNRVLPERKSETLGREPTCPTPGRTTQL